MREIIVDLCDYAFMHRISLVVERALDRWNRLQVGKAVRNIVHSLEWGKFLDEQRQHLMPFVPDIMLSAIGPKTYPDGDENYTLRHWIKEEAALVYLLDLQGDHIYFRDHISDREIEEIQAYARLRGQKASGVLVSRERTNSESKRPAAAAAPESSPSNIQVIQTTICVFYKDRRPCDLEGIATKLGARSPERSIDHATGRIILAGEVTAAEAGIRDPSGVMQALLKFQQSRAASWISGWKRATISDLKTDGLIIEAVVCVDTLSPDVQIEIDHMLMFACAERSVDLRIASRPCTSPSH